MSRIGICLVLHAHLPYIRHAEHAQFLEERWFFEGLMECYLPLLRTFARLADEGIPYRLTVSLSPTLLEMMADPLLQTRFRRHLDALIALAAREEQRLRADARFHPLAAHYRRDLERMRVDYDTVHQGNPAAGFAALREAGRIELITTAATHAYLPLLSACPPAVRAQVAIGARRYRQAFGHGLPGFWLPECGYRPGLEEALAAVGARYFFVESHGLLNAAVQPRDGTFAPVACPNGVIAFARDPECTRRVWSATEGYPGDPEYREFYRDIGFDRTPEELGDAAAPAGVRASTGLKYWRVTGATDDKQPYRMEAAAARAREHAADFLRRCVERGRAAATAMSRSPLLTAMFDAELFGHWWYEGPLWIEEVIRLAAGSGDAELLTPSDYLHRHPRVQVAPPAESSWGLGGSHEPWLNPSNAWMWPRLLAASQRMSHLAAAVDRGRPSDRRRAARQAARHLLLAQASDWAFMIHSGTTSQFARAAFEDQIGRFEFLAHALETGSVAPDALDALEQADPIFQDLDLRDFTAS